jgi:hypothetical protein
MTPGYKVNGRATESKRELWEDMYSNGVHLKYIGIPFVEFDIIETHLRYPNQNDEQLIGQQVGGNFTDLILQDPREPNYKNDEDVKFWFNEPIGGWRQGIARYFYLEEIPIHNVSWPKLSKISDGRLRISINDFKESDVVEGYCESIHLHHGICIDFGCNHLGLLPLGPENWEKIYDDLPCESHVKLRPDFDKIRSDNPPFIFKCKLRRKLDHNYFRWPIELDIIKPEWLRAYIIPVGDYEPRLLIMPEKLTEMDEKDYGRLAGRHYRPPRRYSYRFADHEENNSWIQAQLENAPEDHSREFVSSEISYSNRAIKRKKEELIHKCEGGQILTDQNDFIIENYL